MTIGRKVKEKLKEGVSSSKTRIHLTPGDMIRISREMSDLTQEALAKKTGLKQSTLSALEKNRITLGADRAKVLARALNVHPAVLLFPDWETEKKVA